MAKKPVVKKVVDTMPEAVAEGSVPESEITETPQATTRESIEQAIKTKAAMIRSQFAEIPGVEGAPFDASNPDHLLIAAFMVGARGLIRR